MPTELFANRPTTTVISGGTTAPSSGTVESWTVASSALFPAASSGAGTQFHVADPAQPGEVIAVTNVSGTTWTVTRGAESTTPSPHAPGFTVWEVVSAGDLTAFVQNPMTLTGDTIYGGSAGAPAALAGNTTSTREFLTSTGTGSAANIPAWATIAGGDLPAVSGLWLRAPSVYNPGSPAAPAVSATTLAAFDSTNIQTGSFTAPASGSVVVTASFSAVTSSSTDIYAFALAAHGTVTPVVGNVITGEVSATTNSLPYTLLFVVTGLTPANSYNFDLLGAAATGSITIHAAGSTSVTPTGSVGAPVVMIVQAV